MIENLFAALEGKPLQHAALVTGTKHYLGPFESYGQTVAETPFRENAPRLPGLNFYYTQEDVLFRASRRSSSLGRCIARTPSSATRPATR